jgi:hypothetical protein
VLNAFTPDLGSAVFASDRPRACAPPRMPCAGVMTTADTKRPLQISLKLDNGDCVRGKVGDPGRSAKLVRVTQQIDIGELSLEDQTRRLEQITSIYQRLHPPVNGLRTTPQVTVRLPSLFPGRALSVLDDFQVGRVQHCCLPKVTVLMAATKASLGIFGSSSAYTSPAGCANPPGECQAVPRSRLRSAPRASPMLQRVFFCAALERSKS